MSEFQENEQVTSVSERPKRITESQKQILMMQEKIDNFENQIKSLTLDRMNESKIEETEPQTKISQQDIRKNNDIYLKPAKSSGGSGKFNERFRDKWNFDKEYVNFIAEHNEIIGETIEMWTRPYGGLPCEFWQVPTNKPVWAPRYVAEQISKRRYHRLIMNEQTGVREETGVGTMVGNMIVDKTIQRLDARPVNNSRTSIFMGA